MSVTWLIFLIIVKQGLSIQPVETIDEVFKAALVSQPVALKPNQLPVDASDISLKASLKKKLLPLKLKLKLNKKKKKKKWWFSAMQQNYSNWFFLWQITFLGGWGHVLSNHRSFAIRLIFDAKVNLQ